MAMFALDRGTGNNTTSALTFTFSPAAGPFTARNMAVLAIAVDNSDSSGTAHSTFTVTDSIGNTWTRRVTALYDPGAANAGVEGAVFTTTMDVGVLTTGTTITVTFDANCTVEAWALIEVMSDFDFQSDYIAQYEAAGNGTGSATTSPTVTTDSASIGNMVIGFLFNEYGTAQTVTGDADSTNGTWSAVVFSEVGTTAAGQTVAYQTKAITGTGTQTFNPTLATSSDVILGWIRLSQLFSPPPAPPDILAQNISIMF